MNQGVLSYSSCGLMTGNGKSKPPSPNLVPGLLPRSSFMPNSGAQDISWFRVLVEDEDHCLKLHFFFKFGPKHDFINVYFYSSNSSN